MVVARALKELADGLTPAEVSMVPSDVVLQELQAAVGEAYASNDPVVLCGYRQTVFAGDSYEGSYVVLPGTSEEVAEVVRIANRHRLRFHPRGNGTFLSVAQKTILAKPVGLTSGVIIDTIRMKALKVDPGSRTAVVGAGVNEYELQQAAGAVGLRACTGEAEALVCSNLISHGIISTWGNAYGWGADNYVDATLVDQDGRLVHPSDTESENLYASPHGIASVTLAPPQILTEVTLKLHQILPGEQAVFVPYERLEDAVQFACELAKENVGLSLGVLSSRYFSDFLCPTDQIARDFEYVMTKHLKTRYLVDVIGTEGDRRLIEARAPLMVDEAMMKTFLLSTPTLASLKDHPLLTAVEREAMPMQSITTGSLRPLLVQALNPSPKQIAATYPVDLQGFFAKLYARPEIADPVWLHAHRILPPRLLRQHMFMIRGGFLRANPSLILQAHDVLAAAGQNHQLDHALGFVSFIDEGKIAFIEYDYYYDHTIPEEVDRMNAAVAESLMDELVLGDYIPLEYVLQKGMHRKEHVFYPLPKAFTEAELAQVQSMVQQMVGG